MGNTEQKGQLQECVLPESLRGPSNSLHSRDFQHLERVLRRPDKASDRL